MAVEQLGFGRADAAELVAALRRFEGCGGYAPALHAGDLGWYLRLDDVDLHMTGWRRNGALVAVAIAEDGVFGVSLAPDCTVDHELAGTLADWAQELAASGDIVAQAPAGSVFRAQLGARGWELDPHAWEVLHRALGPGNHDHDDPLTSNLADDVDVADRVCVQRSAFAGSTFTVQRWRQMAAGPGHDPALEFLTRTPDGAPAAAATAWSAGSRRCGILEPVGTHPDHRGRGYGRRAVLAAVAALARAGASGVTVHTPASNQGAVGLYESCGLRPIATTNALVLRRPR